MLAYGNAKGERKRSQVIASRLGMGKSSFALAIAVNGTKHSNKSVVFFSLNKPKLKLLYRLIAQRAYFKCNCK